MKNRELFVDVIESPLNRLYELGFSDTLPDYLQAYLIGLVGYLNSDNDSISEAIEKSNQLVCHIENKLIVSELLHCRLAIRNQDQFSYDTLLEQLEKSPDQIWRGEVFFVLALHSAMLGHHENSMDYFKKSVEPFSKIGANKKSLKALHNYTSAFSRINKDSKRLISEYHFIYKKALHIEEYASAGMSLVNISQEYQKLGALNIALNFSQRAVQVIEENDFGSLHYFLSIVQRCHTLLDLKRFTEANLDFEIAKGCDFNEIAGALEILETQFNSMDAPEVDTKRHNITWQDKLEHLAKTENKDLKVGHLESRFIHFISISPKDKFEVIEHLYGDTLEYETLENRFKALLGRVRKKFPDLILYEKKRYQIVSQGILAQLEKMA